jgi:hypothetical protein
MGIKQRLHIAACLNYLIKKNVESHSMRSVLSIITLFKFPSEKRGRAESAGCTNTCKPSDMSTLFGVRWPLTSIKVKIQEYLRLEYAVMASRVIRAPER